MTSRSEERTWEGAVFAVVVATGAGLAAAKLGDPLGVDEGWTAGQYVLEPFRVAATKYDEPNNHILHTILAWTFHRLVGPSVVALRIPAFLSWCLLLSAVWWFVRQESSWLAAALATTFVGTSRFLVEYGSSARGYVLVLLLFMLALLVGRTLVRRPGSNLRWALWAILLALGFFTVPVMVFPAAIVIAWMLLARRQHDCGAQGEAAFAVRTAAWSVAAAVLGLLLYLPAILSQGASALFGNEFVETVDRSPGVYLPLHLWPRWHRTVPAWGQVVLLGLTAVGMFAACKPPWRQKAEAHLPGGRLAAAAGAGCTAVLLVWPVVLWPRAAAWLLLTFMIVAGIGAAAVSDKLLGSMSGRLGRAARTGVVLLFLGVWAGLSSVPVPRSAFTEWDPTRFPANQAMSHAVAGEAQPGDCVAAPINAEIGFAYISALAVRTYFKAAGAELSKNYEALSTRKTRTLAYYRAAWRRDVASRPQECPPFAAESLEWVTSDILETGRSALGVEEPLARSPKDDRLQRAGRLFVLDAGFRPRERNKVGGHEVEVFLEGDGLAFEVAADFSGGRVYRIPKWVRIVPPAG